MRMRKLCLSCALKGAILNHLALTTTQGAHHGQARADDAKPEYTMIYVITTRSTREAAAEAADCARVNFTSRRPADLHDQRLFLASAYSQ